MLQLEFWHFWFGLTYIDAKIQSNWIAQSYQVFSKPVSKLSSFSQIVSQEKQNVFHLPGLVHPLYPFIPLMFWVKQIQEHFFSESPSCFLQSCYNAKDPENQCGFSARSDTSLGLSSLKWLLKLNEMSQVLLEGGREGIVMPFTPYSI